MAEHEVYDWTREDEIDPSDRVIDAHFDDHKAKLEKQFSKQKEAKLLGQGFIDDSMMFVEQVFYMCIRYQKFLKLFVNAFLYKNP